MLSLVKYLNEKLVVDKNYKTFASPYDLNNGGWKKITIEEVPSKYADIDKSKFKTHCSNKRFYNKDGSPTNWFAWWMALCIFGPMTRKELLRYCELPEGSYPKAWADMSRDGIIYYDKKLRKSCPNPMSEWTVWSY